MGYRSEVALAITKDDYKQMLEDIKTYSATAVERECIREFIEDYCDYKEIKRGDNTYSILHWDWIKWYEDLEEIAFVEEEKRKLHSSNGGNGYAFIRIGEDIEDADTEFDAKNDAEFFSIIQLERRIGIAM